MEHASSTRHIYPELPECSRLSVHETIRRYHHSLLHFLQRRLRCADDAYDVAQETYIRMLKYEGAQDIKSPSSMLFRIAINIANDLGRVEQSRCVADQCNIDDLELACGRPSIERELVACEDLDLLFAAIDGLPPKCKQVFLLSRVQHMTYPEIARHCGISLKMVEKHISRALAVCTQKVGGACAEPS